MHRRPEGKDEPPLLLVRAPPPRLGAGHRPDKAIQCAQAVLPAAFRVKAVPESRKHEPIQGRAYAREIDVRPDQCANPSKSIMGLALRRDGRKARFECIGKLAKSLRRQADKKIALVREMTVRRGLGHTGGFREPPKAEPLQAARFEGPKGLGQQRLPKGTVMIVVLRFHRITVTQPGSRGNNNVGSANNLY